MTEKKETSTKNLMLRLPPDQYEMLKALADLHGNSLNSEVLLAIELAAQQTPGLHISASKLSREASNRMRAALVPSWAKGLDRYRGPSPLGKDPVEAVRLSLEDWIRYHGKLRREIFQLGFATEAMDTLMHDLKSPDGEVFLRATGTEDEKDLIAVLGKIRGIPALRKVCLDYSVTLKQLQKVVEELDLVQKNFNSNLEYLRDQGEVEI